MALVYRCDRCKKLSDDMRPPFIQVGPPKPTAWSFLTNPNMIAGQDTLLVCGDCKRDYMMWWNRGRDELATVTLRPPAGLEDLADANEDDDD